MVEALHGERDVGCGERLSVMPSDALAQFEGQVVAVLVEAPALGQVGGDVVESVLLLLRIEDDEVVVRETDLNARRVAAEADRLRTR